MHYKSSASLLGLPLVHVAIGPSPGESGTRSIAKGWIAIGDIAFGIVFALGGLAVGGFSLGGLSVGVLAIAGLSVGVWSIGGLALGVYSLGGAAIAFWAADGGFAMAQEYARGGQAIAQHSSDAIAQSYFESSGFSRQVRWQRNMLVGYSYSHSLRHSWLGFRDAVIPDPSPPLPHQITKKVSHANRPKNRLHRVTGEGL